MLLGKSGSGKSSLLRCLAQLETSYEGSITYEGRSLADLSPKERYQLLGFVPQSYALFPHMTALDNCIHPVQCVYGWDRETARKRAMEILSFLGVGKVVSSFPHELSGGQQQRVAVGRALLLTPRFLLLDEPTSALDPENTDRLIVVLRDLQKEGMGVIVATQDMAFAEKICDQTVFLEEGKIVEFGIRFCKSDA